MRNDQDTSNAMQATPAPHILDSVLQRQFPVQPHPSHGALTPMQQDGIRYVVGKDGLWREVRTPWLHTMLPVALNPHATLPYGGVAPQVKFLCNPPPRQLWAQFVEAARAALPNEHAAAALWSTTTGGWRLAHRSARSASAAHVDYTEVDVREDEILVVDIHSHATGPAFFSSTDDADDRGSVKISVVFGRCDDGKQIEMVARLCSLDTRLDVTINDDATWGVQL